MSSNDDVPFTVAQQTARISANLNSTLLIQFLFGTYTGVFPAAIYIYLHKENRSASKDRIVIGSIVVLYCIAACTVLVNWFYTSVGFSKDGATRLDIFIGSVAPDFPEGVGVLLDVAELLGFALADVLLVWRCFHACGRSVRKSLLPIALFIVETGLVISSMVYECLLDAEPGFATSKRNETFNRLSAAALVSVALTSLVATFMICRQIYIRTSPGSRSRKRYRTVINTLVESAALYSAALVFEAILDFLDAGSLQSSLEVGIIAQYASAIVDLLAVRPTFY
ncbi:hypothetical protein CPC08DRAFT_716214 [Agrocybe pediades]|nr:hypothetical protein CPC08DRAFT_716214 [Agrocybe pediades]